MSSARAPSGQGVSCRLDSSRRDLMASAPRCAVLIVLATPAMPTRNRPSRVRRARRLCASYREGRSSSPAQVINRGSGGRAGCGRRAGGSLKSAIEQSAATYGARARLSAGVRMSEDAVAGIEGARACRGVSAHGARSLSKAAEFSRARAQRRRTPGGVRIRVQRAIRAQTGAASACGRCDHRERCVLQDV